MAEALALADVVAGYGQSTILNGLSFAAEAGRITTLIGANGAGKSTVLKTVFGLLRPRQGSIRMHGEPIGGLEPRALLARGLVFVPQGRNLFPTLTVRHNLELGGTTLGDRALLRRRMDAVLERFPRLRERAEGQASALSGGEQKMLEIGRALLLEPKVLLIDEPSIGLAPKVVAEVYALLRGLAESGVSILMVEQNVRAALGMSDAAVALEQGRVGLMGPAAQVLADTRIKALFLGGGLAAAG
ncbi:MAG: ABC transporter ATP-binding protein [Alphaproteobacteria bacterium]|nr:ABC transporter ATP-binding protein [Alphaproteobacteria bacterium]